MNQAAYSLRSAKQPALAIPFVMPSLALSLVLSPILSAAKGARKLPKRALTVGSRTITGTYRFSQQLTQGLPGYSLYVL